jgi:hypothetical protein
MTDGILDRWSSAWFQPAKFPFEISDLRIRHDRCSLNHMNGEWASLCLCLVIRYFRIANWDSRELAMGPAHITLEVG